MAFYETNSGRRPSPTIPPVNTFDLVPGGDRIVSVNSKKKEKK
jgi:hypothetical protein